jgi:hypothetical protein
MQIPLGEFVVNRRKYPACESTLSARIDAHGKLMLVERDFGEFSDEVWGGDHERTITVPAEWRDAALLHLLEHRPSITIGEFEQWSKQQGIPAQSSCWP